ncbi:type IV secretion protein IcmL [Rickettsiella grylli]|uniref:type IV secretion protein IcmL n=1 Tax=Rickettsiella grylli TaxID=59196 RepID=UPI0008FD5828|nr:type IV secretion protein IcmL [Rickettsiella grylli]OJA00452.1 type IV secretion protein IcmL [Rickettsiella grylli]
MRLELVKSRKGFYRDNYNRVCTALLMTLLIIFILSLFVLYFTIFSPTPDFYATAQNGQLTRLIPSKQVTDRRI